MFKGKLWLHQIVLFGVLGVLILISLLDGSFVFDLKLLWWLLGAMLGFLFVFGDRLVYSLVTKPDETLSLKAKDMFGQKRIVEGLKLLLTERSDQKELVMRSFLFLVLWVVLAFFTLTSVNNSLARGFILGIGTHLMFDLIYDYRFDKERLDMWFWQIKRTLEPEEKKWFVIIMFGLYIWLTLGL